MDPADVRELIAARVRDIPDYPKPGVIFKDITPLLADPKAFTATVDTLADAYPGSVVDKVVGVEARGFILGAPVAYRIGAGFVPVRKEGKLPSETLAESYALEYGEATVEVHTDGIGPGDRVLVVDDVLATGGTARATVDLVQRVGGVLIGVACLLELSFLDGRERLGEAPFRALVTV
ncbi:MAG: adenine phosphoribosyltransferase [Streptosporangiales bacterium]|nr:adenine phosphoribosyltransferase [Streptosporangiales bacterium]